jgi:hypothetical protein
MNYFNSNLKERTILDILTFDLSTFFYGEYQEINTEEVEGTFLIDYEKKLPWSEFEIFDQLYFRVFNDKKNIHGSNHINATLINRDTEYGKNNVVDMLDKIFQIYGLDDLQKGKWEERDEDEFLNKTFMRTWTIGKEENIYTIQIKFDNEQKLSLSILLFTNLLRETNNL